MVNEQDIDQQHQNDEDGFNWEEYLVKTQSEPAPQSCFCQHAVPPLNEFKVGNKLETYDPRNTSSTCIGTVIEIAGPRLRLRLDGTDDRNDFWLMCDSDLIHPYEYSAKQGRKIQPPLGFGNDLSKWPKFLERIVSSAGEGVFARDECFKLAPTKPPKNEFKIGQKLEAVDPKNPHLICPATVKDVKQNKIFISFDGWRQSSQFWCPYTSRDLFPVGWCKQAGHILQHPGNLEEKAETAASNRAKSAASKRKSQSVKELNKSNDSSGSSSANLDNTTTNNNKIMINTNLNNIHSESTNNNNTSVLIDKNNNSNNVNEQKDSLTKQKIDLSIVKNEAIEPDDYLNDSENLDHQNINVNNSSLNGTNNNRFFQQNGKFFIFFLLIDFYSARGCKKGYLVDYFLKILSLSKAF